VKVYLLYDADMVYDSDRLVGVFSEEEFALDFAKTNPTKKQITRCAGCDLTSTLVINYRVKPFEVNTVLGPYGGVYGDN
jgi:hypothetical protein